jgi:predicted ATP-dependent endonuclease of OLD family
MIENLKVKNFQSLYDVDIALSKFTVITGPSSSGKSALMRSIRTISSNSRGTSFLSYGEKTASISARGQDWVVTLERGASNSYKVSAGKEDYEYTKLAGAVPERVTDLLGIKPLVDGLSISFSDQFDKPYLVADSGQSTARTLGSLTNVNRIFEAVREANRRRQGKSSLLKTRKSDLTELQEQAKSFSDVKSKLEAVAEAQELLSEAKEKERYVAELEKQVDRIIVSEAALARKTVVPEAPDLGDITLSYGKVKRLESAIELASTSSKAHKEASAQILMASQAEAELHNSIHSLLVEAGTCPTCLQTVTTKESV